MNCFSLDMTDLLDSSLLFFTMLKHTIHLFYIPEYQTGLSFTNSICKSIWGIFVHIVLCLSFIFM